MRLTRIKDVELLDRFRVRLKLDDGTAVERDLEPFLIGPVFDPIRNDPALFRQVTVSDGALVWPNGADLCPDVSIWGGAPPTDRAGSTTNIYVTQQNAERDLQVSEPRPRTSWRKGRDLEDEVEAHLRSLGVPYERSKWFSTPFGRWEVDLFVPGNRRTVIECKNPTAEAKSPAGSIQRKIQEAFFKLYLLKHFCSELPKDTRFVLVFGDLPLDVTSAQFGRRDYAKFLKQVFADSLMIMTRSELSRLSHLFT